MTSSPSKSQRKSDKKAKGQNGKDEWDDGTSPSILIAHQKMYAAALTSAQEAMAEMEQQLAICHRDVEQALAAEAARQKALFIRKESREAVRSAEESLSSTLKRQIWISDHHLGELLAPHTGEPCSKLQNPPLAVWRQALQETRGVKLPIFVPATAPMVFGHIQAALVALALEEAQRSSRERLDLAAEDHFSQRQELEASLAAEVSSQKHILTARERLKEKEDYASHVRQNLEKAQSDANENNRQIDLMEAARAKEAGLQRDEVIESVAGRRKRLEDQRLAKEADDIWTSNASDRKHVPNVGISRSAARVPVTKSGPRTS